MRPIALSLLLWVTMQRFLPPQLAPAHLTLQEAINKSGITSKWHPHLPSAPLVPCLPAGPRLWGRRAHGADGGSDTATDWGQGGSTLLEDSYHTKNLQGTPCLVGQQRCELPSTGGPWIFTCHILCNLKNRRHSPGTWEMNTIPAVLAFPQSTSLCKVEDI